MIFRNCKLTLQNPIALHQVIAVMLAIKKYHLHNPPSPPTNFHLSPFNLQLSPSKPTPKLNQRSPILRTSIRINTDPSSTTRPCNTYKSTPTIRIPLTNPLKVPTLRCLKRKTATPNCLAANTRRASHKRSSGIRTALVALILRNSAARTTCDCLGILDGDVVRDS